MTSPDTVTETVTAEDLADGRALIVPMTGVVETIIGQPEIVGDYVMVRTTGTGPQSAYQWRRNDPVDVVTGGRKGD